MNKTSSRIVNVLNRKKFYIPVCLIILAVLLLFAGVQSLAFFSIYGPRLDSVNEKLYALVDEKNRRQQLMKVWEQRFSLEKALGQENETTTRLKSLLRVFNDNSGIVPRETLEALITGLPEFRQQLPDFAAEIDQFATGLERLQDVYTVPYDVLVDDLKNPPWYLQPVAGVLADKSGYLNTVTFNQAMYLAQIGELGTARVLLSGLHASAEDQELLGLIYYGLGRLQWEIFLSSEQRENYFLAVNYLQQSLQICPELSLSKRLLDYLLSLAQTNIFEESQGDPATPSEGEAGAEPEIAPIF